jgi:hypothetical protein
MGGDMLAQVLIAVIFVVAFAITRAFFPHMTVRKRLYFLYIARIVLCLGVSVLAITGNKFLIGAAVLFGIWAYLSSPARSAIAG